MHDVNPPLPLPNAVRYPPEHGVEVQTYLLSKLQPVVAVTADAISVAVQSRAPIPAHTSDAEGCDRKLKHFRKGAASDSPQTLLMILVHPRPAQDTRGGAAGGAGATAGAFVVDKLMSEQHRTFLVLDAGLHLRSPVPLPRETQYMPVPHESEVHTHLVSKLHPVDFVAPESTSATLQSLAPAAAQIVAAWVYVFPELQPPRPVSDSPHTSLTTLAHPKVLHVLRELDAMVTSAQHRTGRLSAAVRHSVKPLPSPLADT